MAQCTEETLILNSFDKFIIALGQKSDPSCVVGITSTLNFFIFSTTIAQIAQLVELCSRIIIQKKTSSRTSSSTWNSKLCRQTKSFYTTRKMKDTFVLKTLNFVSDQCCIIMQAMHRPNFSSNSGQSSSF